MSDIIEMLDKLVQEKTFSLDVLNSISDLKKDAQRLKSSNEDYIRQIRSKDNELSAFRLAEAKRSEKEESLATRERAITTLERETAVAKEAARVYKEMFDRMFANRITREMHNQQVWLPGNGPGSYPIAHTNTDGITREEG